MMNARVEMNEEMMEQVNGGGLHSMPRNVYRGIDELDDMEYDYVDKDGMRHFRKNGMTGVSKSF